MALKNGLQYQALYKYKKDREEDLALSPGDLLTVSKAGLLCMGYKEGDERNPQGWLNGFNECTKEWGDFPGTYVEYLGPVKIVDSTSKSGPPKTLLPTPVGMPTSHLRDLDNEALYSSSPSSFCSPQLKQKLLTDLASVELDPFDGQTLAEMLRGYLQELPCPVIHPAIYSELLYTVKELS